MYKAPQETWGWGHWVLLMFLTCSVFLCLHVCIQATLPRIENGCVELDVKSFLLVLLPQGHWPAPSLSIGVRGERGHRARRWPPKVMVAREECESLLCCRSELAQLLSLCYPSLATLPSCPSSVGISWGSCPVHSTSSFLGPLLTQRGSWGSHVLPPLAEKWTPSSGAIESLLEAWNQTGESQRLGFVTAESL